MSLAIPRGSIYGFLGPNGAGKTTTIRMIFDIIKPTSGRITILGASTALDVRSRIGYLPEEKGLYKTMTAAATVAYFASLKGLPRKAAKRRAYELLERYGLGEFADAKIQALSKGMGQKVQVLCAIAHDPEFVVLDEPFSGLDPVNQQVLEGLIRDLAARGSTVLFSTHVMQHAERLCDRLLLIVKGRKIFDGTVAGAKATIPRRVLISTEGSIDALAEARRRRRDQAARRIAHERGHEGLGDPAARADERAGDSREVLSERHRAAPVRSLRAEPARRLRGARRRRRSDERGHGCPR